MKPVRTAGLLAVMLVSGFLLGQHDFTKPALAQQHTLITEDRLDILQLINNYAYGIDTCSNNGYDYANLFTEDGVFISTSADEDFAAGGRVLAQGHEALAELIGGGPDGCKVMPWTGWSHLMLNPVITPSEEGATGRIYLVQLGMRGPGSVDRHGGYEDVYVKTNQGWRIKSRKHVRNRVWHAPSLQTEDLN